MQNDRQYCYKTTLTKTYGLTASMIWRLGEPDRTVPNPHYRSAPPASLYLIERVERWIEANQAEVDRARQDREHRSRRMTAEMQFRRDKLIEWASTVGIVVAPLPDDFYQRAVIHYESGDVGRGGLIAFARHRYTNYERLLSEIEGKPGCGEAYMVIKARVNALVSDRLAEIELVMG